MADPRNFAPAKISRYTVYLIHAVKYCYVGEPEKMCLVHAGKPHSSIRARGYNLSNTWDGINFQMMGSPNSTAESLGWMSEHLSSAENIK